MRRVIIESPFAPRTLLPLDFKCKVIHRHGCDQCLGYMGILAARGAESREHARYLAACLHDSLMRGEAPFASHGLYTLPNVLDDAIPEERAHGIAAGFAWREGAHATVFYCDLGWSRGMLQGQAAAYELVKRSAHDLQQPHRQVEYRYLGGSWATTILSVPKDESDKMIRGGADRGDQPRDHDPLRAPRDGDATDVSRQYETVGDITAIFTQPGQSRHTR